MLLEFLGELVVGVIFLAIGVGIMTLLGNPGALKTTDSDLLILLGALAAFGVLFTVIAIIRKIKQH